MSVSFVGRTIGWFVKYFYYFSLLAAVFVCVSVDIPAHTQALVAPVSCPRNWRFWRYVRRGSQVVALGDQPGLAGLFRLSLRPAERNNFISQA